MVEITSNVTFAEMKSDPASVAVVIDHAAQLVLQVGLGV
jgi:hypothetical protein